MGVSTLKEPQPSVWKDRGFRGTVSLRKALDEAWSSAVPMTGLLVSKLVDSNAFVKLSIEDAKVTWCFSACDLHQQGPPCIQTCILGAHGGLLEDSWYQ